MAVASSGSSSLKEYLKKYVDNAEDESKKKKKKKKKKPKPDMMGVLVVDEDPVWQKPVEIEEEEESADEEKPQVDEDIEVKRMKRLELLKSRRPFGAISEDGSGWVSVSDTPKDLISDGRASDMSIPHPSLQHEFQTLSRSVDSDISPPRRGRVRNDTPSPEGELKSTTRGICDLSPPRRRRNHLSPELKPSAGSVDPDMYPSRRGRVRNDTPSPEHELKPTTRGISDLSPPRRRRSHLSPELSLPSGSVNPNMSPPRRGRTRNDSRSPEYEHKPTKRELDDLSPPRWRKNHHSPEIMTKPLRPSDEGRRHYRVTDSSPPRKRKARFDTPSPEPDRKPSELGKGLSDMSPVRRKPKRDHSPSLEPDIKPSHPFDSAPDLSPPRRGGTRQQSRPRPTEPDMLPVSSVSDLSPPRKVRKESTFSIQQPKHGLISGRDMKEEIDKSKKEDWLRFKNMDPAISGRGAEGVYRDKRTGERVSKEQRKSEKEKLEEKPKEIKLEWGKGLAQKREAEARQQELEFEKEKPFARTRDDPELDSMLKEQVRWGDPMAHLVKKKNPGLLLPDIGDNERMKESGFIVPQEIPNHSWLKRGLDAAPNRYGIRPGRHWDGVDRSNGFEKQMFTRINEKQATEREAYLWSVSDM